MRLSGPLVEGSVLSAGWAKFGRMERMRVIIAGGRDIDPPSKTFWRFLAESGFDIDCVLSGGATGIDAHGEMYALANGIPLETYPAEWDKHGKAAGPLRNAQMARNADALILIWNGKSKGSRNMLQAAVGQNLKIHQVIWA